MAKNLFSKSIFIFAFLIFSLQSFAKYDFNANCKKAYKEIVDLNFLQAKIIIANEKKVNPDNLIVDYLNNTIDFLSILISEDENVFNTLKTNKDPRIKAFENGDKNTPYYRFCLAEVYLQWAAARIIFNEYLTAAYEINKAYRLLKRNNEDFPTFIPNLKSLGLLNALIGSIPDNFKWVTSIIGVNGTIEQGINQLAIVFRASLQNEHYSHFKAESLFFLAYVSLNLNNDRDDALKIIKFIETNDNLQELIKSSALVNFSVAYLYLRTKLNNDKAIRLLTDFIPCANCLNFNFRDYTNGLARLNSLDKDADFYFNKFLKNYKGQNSIKAAYQKLAWHALINADTSLYFSNMAKVKLYGKLNTDEDKLAQTEAESNLIPNIILLKARLLFDGGYYSKAIGLLDSVKPEEVFLNKKNILEYYYRMARIYHEKGDIAQAIPHYITTINQGVNETYYFAANASLQLGLIYESQNKKQLAKEYFEKAMNMKNTEYENSINQRAKSGLLRLK